MRIVHRKSSIASALSLVIGSLGAGTITADTVVSWDLQDFDSDGLKSDFAFYSAPPGNGPNTFGAGGETGCTAALDGNVCDPIAFDSGTISNFVFSTGFNFGGTGTFAPNITADAGLTTGSASGQIDIDKSGSLALSFTALDFAGLFPLESGTPTQFILRPDIVSPNGTGGLGSGPLATVTNLGAGSFGATVRYVGTINDPGGSFHNFQANWRLEGVMDVLDSPPLIFINGNPGGDISGNTIVNEAANTTYVDQGAVCQDVVDGQITGAALTTIITNPNAPSTGPDGGQFTVDYQCTDSQANIATARRTINVGPDIIPPVVTLGVGAAEPGRSDTSDGATVNILVGVPYVDAGATCQDNRDGTIPLSSVTPPFFVTPNPAAVDTSAPSTGNNITFSCNDTSNNGPVIAVRTVNVLADDQAPVVSLVGANPLTVTIGSTYNDPGATCVDTNPVDTGSVDISANLVASPTTIDTSVPTTVAVTYNCSDAVGNAATQKTRTVNVVTGKNFRIRSMTISDLDGDKLVGCFKFNSLDTNTCIGANRYSSDGSAETGFAEFANTTIPGSGTELDDSGNPIGIRFWDRDPATRDATYQPITQFLNPGFGGVPQPISKISPGFNFTGFPFVPMTFDPPSEDADPPSGFVTLTGSENVLTIESLPFSGLYNSDKPNIFFLDPDEGTLTATILQDNGDDDGATRTFNYFMTWSHVITAEEDPTNAFVNFNAFWRLEGVITADSVPFVVNNPPEINASKAAQDGRDPTTQVVSSGGLVTASVSATDPDGDGLSYDWSQSPVVPAGPTDQPSFTFDPATLAEGGLGLMVIVTDDNTDSLSTTAEIVLTVTAEAPALSDTQDSNGNGIDDTTEGFGDDDNDGIANYQDPIDGSMDPSRNRIDFSDPSRGDMVASAGRLRLGQVTTATGDGVFTATEDDIAQYGGSGVTSVNNAADRLSRVGGNIGPIDNGIRDFTIDGLTVGAAVQIVIPQDQPLPPLPGYRKYTVVNGWVPFVRASGNALASAPKVGGVCPGPGGNEYDLPVDSNGNTVMVEGDECVRLTIVDGGPNDADFTRNGVVVDPGTVSANGTAPSARSLDNSLAGGAGGCTLSAASSKQVRGDWWLLVFGLLGLFRVRRRVT